MREMNGNRRREQGHHTMQEGEQTEQNTAGLRWGRGQISLYMYVICTDSVRAAGHANKHPKHPQSWLDRT